MLELIWSSQKDWPRPKNSLLLPRPWKATRSPFIFWPIWLNLERRPSLTLKISNKWATTVLSTPSLPSESRWKQLKFSWKTSKQLALKRTQLKICRLDRNFTRLCITLPERNGIFLKSPGNPSDNRYKIVYYVLALNLRDQSLLLQPLHPQFLHITNLPSSKSALGTRQIHTLP